MRSYGALDNGADMSILVDRATRVIVQGITGGEGRFHTERMIEYGTQVVGGVTPGRGGEAVFERPIFNTVEKAAAETGANASVIFVPPAGAADAILEAADSLSLVVAITEGIPVMEMTVIRQHLKGRGVVLIGPNCPGIISPGKTKLGIMPGNIHREGVVGVISRSGTLTYEVVAQLTRAGLGQSTCVGIGGDPIIGSNFIDILSRFKDDPETEAVVLVGEIGGRDEEDAAAYIQAEFAKPVFGFVAGRTAPPGRRMGHAGAIISGRTGRASDKLAALRAAGIQVVEDLSVLGETVKARMS